MKIITKKNIVLIEDEREKALVAKVEDYELLILIKVSNLNGLTVYEVHFS